MSKSDKINLFSILIAVGLGIYVPFSNVVTFLILAFAAVFVGFISVLALLFSVFGSGELRRIGGIGLVSVVVFGFVAISLEGSIRDYKQYQAKTIIANLEDYRKRTGKYPQDISQIENHDAIESLEYSLFNDSRDFRIQYYMDGFNRQFYQSDTKEWGTLGWND